MIVASPEFPFVFIPFWVAYWIFRFSVSIQKLMLLTFGYLFYSLLSPWFSLALFAYTLFTWSVSWLLCQIKDGTLRNFLFTFGVSGGLALLAYFKYFDFFSEQAEIIIRALGLQWAVPAIDVLMPLGISFYVFQSISYLAEIQKRNIYVSGFMDLCLYLCFLPTLMAGPICRPSDLLAQIISSTPRKILDLDKIILLLCSFVIKKVWIASWLSSSIVDPAFSEPSAYNGLELIMAAVGYAFQIYFDFSGYTDLATLLALLLGYELPLNFNIPYLSQSLSQFWGRWHISLSTWIRDYIYFPMGGSYFGMSRTIFNLMVAMTLSGLWHGASMKFVAWGMLHGAALSLEKILGKYFSFKPGVALTFIVVCAGWVIFRAQTLESGLSFFVSSLDWTTPLNPSLPHLSFIFLIFAAFLSWKHSNQLINAIQSVMQRTPLVVRAITASCVITTALALSPDGMPAFIYTKF